LKLEKKFQKNLHCGITVSMRILITSHTSETPCIFLLKIEKFTCVESFFNQSF